jgi:hypothetical protein
MGWDISKLETYPVGTIHKIPVIGRVAAGSGCLAQYDPLGYEIATDIKNPEEYIYFKVKGDSMHPNIMDGDLALIHIQPDVESGELAVVVVNCEEGIIKKVVKHDGAVSLVSFNPGIRRASSWAMIEGILYFGRSSKRNANIESEGFFEMLKMRKRERQRQAVTHIKNKHHGVIWWLLIGWWWGDL